MQSIKWALALLVVAIVTTACDGRPPRNTWSADQEKMYANVHRIFDVDGCHVYEFYGNRYVVTCPNGSASVQWTETCGKNCRREVQSVTGPQP